jgi:hypothetical protein
MYTVDTCTYMCVVLVLKLSTRTEFFSLDNVHCCLSCQHITIAKAIQLVGNHTHSQNTCNNYTRLRLLVQYSLIVLKRVYTNLEFYRFIGVLLLLVGKGHCSHLGARRRDFPLQVGQCAHHSRYHQVKSCCAGI